MGSVHVNVTKTLFGWPPISGRQWLEFAGRCRFATIYRCPEVDGHLSGFH